MRKKEDDTMRDSYSEKMLQQMLEEMVKDEYYMVQIKGHGAKAINLDMAGLQLLIGYFSGEIDVQKILDSLEPKGALNIVRDEKSKMLLYRDGSCIRTFSDYLHNKGRKTEMNEVRIFVCYSDGSCKECYDFGEIINLPVLRIAMMPKVRENKEADESMTEKIYLDGSGMKAAEDDREFVVYRPNENGVIISPVLETEIRVLKDVSFIDFSGEVTIFIQGKNGETREAGNWLEWIDLLYRKVIKIMSSKDKQYHEIYIEDEEESDDYTVYTPNEDGIIFSPNGGDDIHTLEDINGFDFPGELVLYVSGGKEIKKENWSEFLDRKIVKILSTKDGLKHKIYVED